MKTSIPALFCSLAMFGLASSSRAVPPPVLQEPPEIEPGLSAGYASASVAVSGFNFATVVVNSGHHDPGGSPTWGYIGALSGLLGVGLGGAVLIGDHSNEDKAVGVTNLGVGAVATAFGIHAIVKAKRAPTPAPAVVGAVGVGIVGHGLAVQLTF